MSVFTHNDLKLIREKPHLLGHLAGKTRLKQLHSEWILYIWDSVNQERCLQAHRDSYKTTSIDVIGSIYWMLFHPNDRIGIIRKSFTDAAATVDVIRNCMEKTAIREIFKLAYGHYPEFKTRRNGKIEFTFKETATQEGNVNAYGIRNSITGTHLDKIICDDFVTLEDRVSQAERERTLSAIREIRTNIIETGKAVSFIGTPWHKNDAWSILPEPVKYDVFSTKLMTHEQIEDKRKKTTPSLFAANYELKHLSDDGRLFQNPKYIKWATQTARGRCYGHLDAAFDGTCTNALTFMAKKEDGRVQAVGKTYDGNVKNWYDFIEAEYRRRKCIELIIENNADKGATADQLRKRGLNIREYNEKQNKHIKISIYLYEGWNQIEWDYDTDSQYMEQIIDYEKGSTPDDCPDSAASLWRDKFSVKSKNNSALYED